MRLGLLGTADKAGSSKFEFRFEVRSSTSGSKFGFDFGFDFGFEVRVRSSTFAEFFQIISGFSLPGTIFSSKFEMRSKYVRSLTYFLKAGSKFDFDRGFWHVGVVGA